MITSSLSSNFTILCSSTKTPPKDSLDTNNNNKTPSLSDQLKPLLHTTLKDKPNPNVITKQKSIWVNPTRPKPYVLNLQRQKRTFSYNPKLKDVKEFIKKLNDYKGGNEFEVEFGKILDEWIFPHAVDRDNVLLVLNGLKPWEKTMVFLKWVKRKSENEGLFEMETIFYNVVMKSLRGGKQFGLVEDLANEMVLNDIELDNITYSTIISCAKRCGEFDKAIEWFEKMYRSGVMPDEVTYSAVLDVYAKLGKIEEVLSLYERGRATGWKPDAIAFSVMCRMFGEAGDYDGIRNVLSEMKAVGVAPNVAVYNTLLQAMGKAGKPGMARSLFEEMVESGLTPNGKTLTALVKVYGKARWGKDALELWERMRANKWPMDFILFNTLLSMCADLGFEEEAETLFEDMKRSEICKPDSWSYTAMLNIYGSIGDVEKAMTMFYEMYKVGVNLNVMGCTCLIQCLGRAKRIDDVVMVFGISVERGVKPDDRLCGCLLSVVSFCEGKNEVEKILDCLQTVNPKLVSFVKLLVGENEVNLDTMIDKFKEILNEAEVEVRRPFCNCLIDICRNQKFEKKAHDLLYLGSMYGLYPGLHSKTADEWSLNLRSLSVGAAHTAFEEWMGTLSKVASRKEALPELFSAHTGPGTHKFSQGLVGSFASHLKKLGAPFRESDDKAGHFVASQEDLLPWVHSINQSTVVNA